MIKISKFNKNSCNKIYIMYKIKIKIKNKKKDLFQIKKFKKENKIKDYKNKNKIQIVSKT